MRTHYYGQTLCKRQCSLYLYIQTCLLRFHQSYRQKAKRAAPLSVALDPFAWLQMEQRRSSLHFAFCTIVIFGARCLYMIKDRIVEPRPSTRNREATKTIHQEYIITSKGLLRFFSILFQGHFITTSYACIGTPLDFADSTPFSASTNLNAIIGHQKISSGNC